MCFADHVFADDVLGELYAAGQPQTKCDLSTECLASRENLTQRILEGY